MMNKAIFLDRDGVINRERGEYTYRKEDFFFNEDVFRALKYFREKGYLLIVVSNQGGISKQQYRQEDVEELHAYMRARLEEQGIPLDEIYYCPHHSDHEKCLCRKPGSLMIEKALARFRIDPRQAYLVGDHTRDEQAARNAGVHSILIPPNGSLWKIRHLIP